jgi:ubiquinone/menaquinone biosynthesis C-methylase UbiE
MASRLHYRVIGADSSRQMLARAQEKDTESLITWDYQEAQTLTYSHDSFDAVFMSHLLHHVDSPVDVLKECRRVLAAAGPVIVRYGAMEQIRDDAEHTFFPESLAIDEARTPTVKRVEKWLGDAGFSGIISEEVVQQTYRTGTEHLEATRTRSTSVLTLISEEAFDKGIRAMTEYISQNPDDPWLLINKMTLTVGYNS